MDWISSENVFYFEQDDLLIKSMPILQELRKTGVFCDIVIKADSKEFPAHRPVLAATIPYFYTMLTSEFVESKQREIIIQDIDSSILEALIDFSYSGKIKVDHQNIQNLMKVADFVGLDHVKNACADYLKTNIQTINVFEIAKLANLLNCHELVSAAEIFINKNFSEITETNEFLMLGFQELKQLIGKDGLTCSEEKVFVAAMKWVKHDKAERSSLLPEILSKVRLSLVSIRYLVNVVSKEELIQSSNECLHIVDKAKNYHLMQWENKWAARSRNSPKFSNIVPNIIGKQLKFYDVLANEWLNEEDLNGDRSSSVIASLENKIYIIGGRAGNEHSLDIYDLESKKWSKGKNTINGGHNFGATTLDNCIYVCGGTHPRGNLISTVDCYSIKENSWKAMASMKIPREDVGVASLNGYIFAIGGYNTERLNFCEKYDPTSNTWTNINPLLHKRDMMGVAMFNKKIYVCGGHNNDTHLNSCEVYDPSSGTWSSITPMNVKRSKPTLASFNEKLYAVGGFNDSGWTSSVEVYSPETNSWEILP